MAGVVVGVLAWLVAAGACAHSEGDDEPDDGMLLDCEHLPADAARQVPDPVSAFTQIECSPAGQKLVAGPGWRWRYPATWTVRPEAPSWAPEASTSVPGRKYFRSFEVSEVKGEALAQVHERLLREASTYAFYFEAVPQAMTRLVATNSHGHTMEIFFPREREDRYWGFLCVPQCRPEYGFMVERLGK
jgi:hypothetical protein